MDPVEPNNLHRVFAYGSNMHLADLRRWALENGLTPPRILHSHGAILRGYALVWNYRSVARRGGAANVGPSSRSRVIGVVMEVDQATLALFDSKEGHPGRYSRGTAPLKLVSLDSGETMSAWVYRVGERWLCEDVVRPTSKYRALLVEAARQHGLPEDYIEELEAIPVIGADRISLG